MATSESFDISRSILIVELNLHNSLKSFICFVWNPKEDISINTFLNFFDLSIKSSPMFLYLSILYSRDFCKFVSKQHVNSTIITAVAVTIATSGLNL